MTTPESENDELNQKIFEEIIQKGEMKLYFPVLTKAERKEINNMLNKARQQGYEQGYKKGNQDGLNNFTDEAKGK
jgi:flagellar biosynthesis/type III secretory pathway protein FliH